MSEQKNKLETNNLGFSSALQWLKIGESVARTGWNGKGMFIQRQTPGVNSKMTLPYIYMKTADDKLVPWLCSQTDMLANDWRVLTETGEDDE